jgi:hypothetical protein
MRHSRLLVIVLLGGVTATAWAKSPKKSELVHIFCPARYAYVTTADGDIMRPDVLQEDRDAVTRVQDQLKEWKRYLLVYEPQNADLVFVVRMGRTADIRTMGGVAGGSPGMPPSGGVAVGTPQRSPSLDPSNAGQGPEQGPVGPGGANRRWGSNEAEVGPPDDLLAVYAKPGDVNTQSALWQRTMTDGLDGPGVPLFQKIRKAVDETCREKP